MPKFVVSLSELTKTSQIVIHNSYNRRICDANNSKKKKKKNLQIRLQENDGLTNVVYQKFGSLNKMFILCNT